MKKDPEHLEEVANLFKTYIPYTNGKITRFFAPYDGKVHLHTNESETVFSDIPLYSIFPSDRWYDKDTYSTMTNGFMLKSNIKGSELVKKGDLICIVVEPYSKNIQKAIKDYFMIDPKIAELRQEIQEIKDGNYGLSGINTSFLNYIHSFAPDFLKPNKDDVTRSLARLNADIVKCKAKKVELKTKLTKYYNSEISKLRQYL